MLMILLNYKVKVNQLGLDIVSQGKGFMGNNREIYTYTHIKYIFIYKRLTCIIISDHIYI